MNSRQRVSVMGWILLIITAGALIAGVQYPTVRFIPLLIVFVVNLILLLGLVWHRWNIIQQGTEGRETLLTVLLGLILIINMGAVVWSIYHLF
jgi:uncharacterized membrane protein YphA (DoxX/SURF4 family)